MDENEKYRNLKDKGNCWQVRLVVGGETFIKSFPYNSRKETSRKKALQLACNYRDVRKTTRSNTSTGVKYVSESISQIKDKDYLYLVFRLNGRKLRSVSIGRLIDRSEETIIRMRNTQKYRKTLLNLKKLSELKQELNDNG